MQNMAAQMNGIVGALRGRSVPRLNAKPQRAYISSKKRQQFSPIKRFRAPAPWGSADREDRLRALPEVVSTPQPVFLPDIHNDDPQKSRDLSPAPGEPQWRAAHLQILLGSIP